MKTKNKIHPTDISEISQSDSGVVPIAALSQPQPLWAKVLHTPLVALSKVGQPLVKAFFALNGNEVLPILEVESHQTAAIAPVCALMRREGSNLPSAMHWSTISSRKCEGRLMRWVNKHHSGHGRTGRSDHRCAQRERDFNSIAI